MSSGPSRDSALASSLDVSVSHGLASVDAVVGSGDTVVFGASVDDASILSLDEPTVDAMQERLLDLEGVARAARRERRRCVGGGPGVPRVR
jgi:hypothetical protein